MNRVFGIVAIVIFCVTGCKDQTNHIPPDSFRATVKDLVEGTMEPCKLALKDAGLEAKDIDDVVLVGGQTRMPLVQKAVEKFFGKPPRKDVNPDEAVAIGAAIQGGVLSGDMKDILLLDVTPLSLGVETLGGVMTKLIEKNTTIPTQASEVFSTADDNQASVTLHVLQGEREQASENKSLGQFNLTDIPGAPRGTPQIAVSFDIDANGILSVSAEDKNTGKQQSIVIKASSGLSQEEIDKMIRDAKDNAAADREFQELVTLRNQADTLIHTIRSSMNSLENVNPDDKKTMDDLLAELETEMKGKDGDKIRTKMQEVEGAWNGIFSQQQAGSAGQEQAAPDQATEEATPAEDDDVVDAEFEDS